MSSRSPRLKESNVGGTASHISVYMCDRSHSASCRRAFPAFKQYDLSVFLHTEYPQIISSNWLSCRYFWKMMDIFSSPPFYMTYIQFPSGNNIPAKIQWNPKFFLYFRDAIGAIDGSHIPVTPPALFCPLYRNPKGFLLQNMLFTCNFCWNLQSHVQPHCHQTDEITDTHMLHVHYIPHVCSTLYEYITRSTYFIFIHIPVSGSL